MQLSNTGKVNCGFSVFPCRLAEDKVLSFLKNPTDLHLSIRSLISLSLLEKVEIIKFITYFLKKISGERFSGSKYLPVLIVFKHQYLYYKMKL